MVKCGRCDDRGVIQQGIICPDCGGKKKPRIFVDGDEPEKNTLPQQKNFQHQPTRIAQAPAPTKRPDAK